ncbi:MAG: amidohydrolase family protein [Endozoicomonas sp.]
MNKNIRPALIVILIAAFAAGCTSSVRRDLGSFRQPAQCYDRDKEPFTSVVDTHVHFRPFGGLPVPFPEMSDYLDQTGVLFVNVYGIGQSLPVDSGCTYYLNCLGTPALPSIKNDFANAEDYLEFDSDEIHMTLSMTFPDLANPDDIVDLIHLYDREYPGMFKWMGEVNLIKQALLGNEHEPAARQDIAQWAEFMAILRDRNIPINIHSDLGSDSEPKKFLHLMEHVLELYPDNKVVWAHMGLSKELVTIPPEEHIQTMKVMLDAHPNLMLDITWRVLEDNYFSQHRDSYTAFINEYSDRILPGTDFVASRDKNFEVYKSELEINSEINKYLDDNAFRNIAMGENYFRLMGLDYQAPEICD